MSKEKLQAFAEAVSKSEELQKSEALSAEQLRSVAGEAPEIEQSVHQRLLSAIPFLIPF